MFGFLRKKIKSFADKFSEEADEEQSDGAEIEQTQETEAHDTGGAQAAATADPEHDVAPPHDEAVPRPETIPPDKESEAASSDVGTVSTTEAEPADVEDEVERAERVATEREALSGEALESAVAEPAETATETSGLATETPAPEVHEEPETVQPTRPSKEAAPEQDLAVGESVGEEVEAPRNSETGTIIGDEAAASSAPPEATAPLPPEEEKETERESERTAEAEEPAQKRGGFGRRMLGAFTKRSLSDQQFETLFEDLEMSLLEANTAFDAVQALKESLRERLTGERISRFSAHDDVAQALKESIAELFEEPEDLVALADTQQPLVLMLIGVNGSGKTTSAAKLARAFQKAGKRPVLAAADTFRAAAIAQLETHADALDVRMIKHDYGADPAAVAYDAVAHAKSGKADVVIIDTAGRLHSNENLLKELEKVKRVCQPHRIIFVGESIAGNDLLEQAETFDERVGIDGIILTKTDVDESGGGALSVSHVTGKPIDYLGAGQSYDDLEAFSVDRIAQLLGLE